MTKQEAIEQLIHDSLVVGAASYGSRLLRGEIDTSTPVIDNIRWADVEAVLDVKADLVAQILGEAP